MIDNLTKEHVDEWLAENPYPTPTGFCLDMEIDPATLSALAKENEVIKYMLYRLIAYGENYIMTKVYGSKNFIARIEDILYGSASFQNEATGEDTGLFVSA